MKRKGKAGKLLAVGVLAVGTSSISMAAAGVANASICDPITGPFGLNGGNHCVYDTYGGTHVDCTVVIVLGGWGRGCTFTNSDGTVWGCNEGGFVPTANVVRCPDWLY